MCVCYHIAYIMDYIPSYPNYDYVHNSVWPKHECGITLLICPSLCLDVIPNRFRVDSILRFKPTPFKENIYIEYNGL